MSWWRKLIGLNSRSGDANTRGAPEDKATSGKPPLVLLASDSGGLTALRIHRFEDAKAACEYVEFRNHRLIGGTVYPFWALPAEPSGTWRAGRDEPGEPVVLIRDDRREDIVYPFSFADLPTAWTFARQEIGRGLEFDKISIYWAVPVEIVLDDRGRARIRPDAPPPVSSTSIIPSAPDLVIESKTTIVRKKRSEESTARTNGHNGDDASPPPFPVVQHRVEAVDLNGAMPAPEMRANGEDAHDVPPPIAKANGGISQVAPHDAGETSANDERVDEKGGERDVQPPSDKTETPDDPTKILRWRRLDRHDGPFKGFGSPHGRF